MQRVGRFEKVSIEQFKNDFLKHYDHFEDEIYDNVRIPVRMTSGSAGYDFVSPVSFSLTPGDTISFPTGIKCFIEPGWFLGIFPRSSLGIKYRLQLDNCIGVVDEDFYGNMINEGDILMQLTNDSKEGKILHVEIGDRIAQGIFIPYGITYNDNATGIRTGGIGSTNENV